MTKRKSASHGKKGSGPKRLQPADAEMDVLQERFNGMELDFGSLASLLGPQ